MADPELKEYFAVVLECFPGDKRDRFRDPDDREAELEALTGASPSGHARRWFDVTDGQDADEAFFDGYRLMSLEESAALAEERGALPAEYQDDRAHGLWVAIAENECGDLLMIDDRDGRVLEVFQDDSAVDVLDADAGAWLLSLAADCDSGALMWDADRGLTTPEDVKREQEDLAEAARVVRRRRSPGSWEPIEAPSLTWWQFLYAAYWLLMSWYLLRQLGWYG